MSGVETLESLANETLIDCFGYLNAWDLFYAFDHLNARFSVWIRSIPLYLNFENLSNSNVKQFCHNIQKNPSIKQQIHSLHLSDEKTLQQAEIFLRYFSFNEFSSLKSLVLTQIECSPYAEHDIEEILKSLPNLSCFVLNVYERSSFDMPDDVCLSNVKRLTIPRLSDDHLMFDQQWLTTSLTLASTSLRQIMKIFQCAPELREFSFDYLKVDGEYLWILDELQDLQRHPVIHLKRLRMKTSTRHFQVIESVLQCTPNLEVLTINGSSAKEMIDADRWEQLIRYSLINLTVFQFQFWFSQTEFSETNANFLSKFERFQSDFWRTEHQWPVRWEHSALSYLIHTIPYPFNEYKLSPSTDHYSLQSINPTTVFDRVTKISVLYEGMQTSPSSSYFSNIIILKLETDSKARQFRQNYVLAHRHIESLTSTICLSNVTDLSIDRSYSLESSSVMMRLLEKTSNISSLKIDLQMFRLLCTDAQVCLILKKNIKSLFLQSSGYSALFSGNYSFEQFYETFSELEELECDLDESSQFITLIQSLLKLSNIAVCFTEYYTTPNFDSSWSRDYSHTVNPVFRCTDEYVVPGRLPGDTRRYVWRFKRQPWTP